MAGRHLVRIEVAGRPATLATAHERPWKEAVQAAVAASGVRPQNARVAVRIDFRLAPARTQRSTSGSSTPPDSPPPPGPCPDALAVQSRAPAVLRAEHHGERRIRKNVPPIGRYACLAEVVGQGGG